MDHRWYKIPNPENESLKKPLLAAEQILAQQGFATQVETILNTDAIKHAPNGTILLSENRGLISPEQSRELSAWVRRGNTLIFFPQTSKPVKITAPEQNKDEEEEDVHPEDTGEDAIETPQQILRQANGNVLNSDPIGRMLGVESFYPDVPAPATKVQKPKPNGEEQTEISKAILEKIADFDGALPPQAGWSLTPPGVDYAMELQKTGWQLRRTENSVAPYFFVRTSTTKHLSTWQRPYCGNATQFVHEYFATLFRPCALADRFMQFRSSTKTCAVVRAFTHACLV